MIHTIPEYPHAILSPSKAHLWLNCLGGVGAAKDQPRKPPSRYAAEGTCYHDVARRALVENKDCSAYVGDHYEVQGFQFTVDADNAEQAQSYVDAVRALPGKRFVEVDLDYSHILGLPKYTAKGGERFPVAAGTGDCVVLDYENKIVWVIDLKFGRGDIVYAKLNPQLRLYGIAAVERYELLGIEDDWKVSLAIHQPRANHFDSEIITVGELKAWAEAQKANANRAYTLWASPHLLNLSDLTPGEKQCRWCPLSGNCKAQDQKILDRFPKGHAEAAIPQLATLDDVQIVEALDLADEVEHWLSAVRAHALARALNGAVLPNWKVVEGRRGNRKLDEDGFVELDVAALLEIGIEEPEGPSKLPVKDALHFALNGKEFAPPELLTAAKLQKVIEKKAPLLWAALQAHITQADGKPSLERMLDPRPPMTLLTPEFPLAPVDGKESLL